MIKIIQNFIVYNKSSINRSTPILKNNLIQTLFSKNKIKSKNSKKLNETFLKLDPKTYFKKKFIFQILEGVNLFLISKKGKNFFVSWLDVFGRLKLKKSLMTLNDPKNNTTKKQKSFSTYFLLKSFSTFIRKRYRFKEIGVLLKGSLGIRHKKSLISGISHSGLKIKRIVDITNIPFNGCKLKKKKRL
jgi:ribosomal protein S11